MDLEIKTEHYEFAKLALEKKLKDVLAVNKKENIKTNLIKSYLLYAKCAHIDVQKDMNPQRLALSFLSSEKKLDVYDVISNFPDTEQLLEEYAPLFDTIDLEVLDIIKGIDDEFKQFLSAIKK